MDRAQIILFIKLIVLLILFVSMTINITIFVFIDTTVIGFINAIIPIVALVLMVIIKRNN